MNSQKRVQRPGCVIIASGREADKVVAAEVAAATGKVSEVEVAACGPEDGWA
jgi:hypothetical protein